MRYNHGSNGCSPSNLGACCIKALRIFIPSIPSLLAYLSSSFFSRASRSTCNARAKALEIASVWSTELWELCNTWGGGGNDSRWLILDHASSYYLLRIFVSSDTLVNSLLWFCMARVSCPSYCDIFVIASARSIYSSPDHRGDALGLLRVAGLDGMLTRVPSAAVLSSGIVNDSSLLYDISIVVGLVYFCY